MSAPIDLAHTPDFALGGARVRPALRAFVGADGVAQTLEPRVMQVLVALAQRGGDVTTRDDLIALCWEGRAVSEDAINRPIALARKLGETTGAFAIETIPRVGYRLIASGAPVQRAARVLEASPVLAVLAFDNFSPDPDLTFFSDGVSDEILQAISRAVKTIGRGSSFQFRGADKALSKVAGELGATHVLDGSVRRAGGNVRINAQLIEAAGQTVIWRAQYERPAGDLLAVQDEIATTVAAALNVRLAPAPPAGAIDPVTYEAFLRSKETPLSAADYRAQIEAIDAVTRAAPDFGPAWVEAFRVRALSRRNIQIDEAESQRLYDEMQVIAARATAVLGPDNSALIATLANWRPWAGAWTECETQLRRAISGAPHTYSPQATLASFFLHTGRQSEAVALLRSIREVNALDYWSASLLAGALGALGLHDEEFQLYETTARQWPGAAVIWRNMITSAAYEGRFDIVDRWLTPANIARFAAAHPNDLRAVQATVTFCRDPNEAECDALLARLRARFESTGRVRLMNACNAARFCDVSAVHDIAEQADFSHIPDPLKGYEPGDYGAQILFQSSSARFRSDPRFVALCARIGLVAHWRETGRWPDCAFTTPYDFKAECARHADTPLG